MNARPRMTDFGDGVISDWHRSLGDQMPAVDLDKVLVEYTRGRPKAIVEYKHANAKTIDWTSPSFNALRELCAPRTYELPLMIVRFNDFCTEFVVQPLNVAGATLITGNPRRKMNEEQFKVFLEMVRNR